MIRHVFGSRTLQDLRFRLGYDETENSREKNAHEHTGLLYEGAHPSVKLEAFQSFTSPNLTREVGTDTSHWDGNVNEQLSKAAGIDFTIIKAMDGTVPTRYYRENRARAKDAGVIQGPYAWLYPNKFISCKTQAQALFALLSSVGFDELPPVIDWEWTTYAGQPANPNLADLEMWADEWNRLHNRKSILYTAAGYARQFGAMPARLINKFAGLWAANYGVTHPAMPPGWLTWDLHQFTASGESAIYAPNDAGKLEVDLNYTADPQTLYRLTGALPPEPPDGGTMLKYYRLNTTAANIRGGPGAGYDDLGDLVRDDVVQVEEILGNWSRFTNAQHKDGTPVNLDSGEPVVSHVGPMWSTNAYFVEVPGLPNPPAPPPDPTEYIMHVKDGVSRKFIPE